jgi:hypothetical protein
MRRSAAYLAGLALSTPTLAAAQTEQPAATRGTCQVHRQVASSTTCPDDPNGNEWNVFSGGSCAGERCPDPGDTPCNNQHICD